MTRNVVAVLQIFLYAAVKDKTFLFTHQAFHYQIPSSAYPLYVHFNDIKA